MKADTLSNLLLTVSLQSVLLALPCRIHALCILCKRSEIDSFIAETENVERFTGSSMV